MMDVEIWKTIALLLLSLVVGGTGTGLYTVLSASRKENKESTARFEAVLQKIEDTLIKEREKFLAGYISADRCVALQASTACQVKNLEFQINLLAEIKSYLQDTKGLFAEINRKMADRSHENSGRKD